MTKQRFYINTRGADDSADAAYRTAILFACKMAEHNESIKKVTLLIDDKGKTGWFSRIYGPETVRNLFKGAHLENCDLVYQFQLAKVYKGTSNTPDEVVIACGLYNDKLFKIDTLSSVQAIIAIPWMPEKVDKWLEKWNPQEIPVG